MKNGYFLAMSLGMDGKNDDGSIGEVEHRGWSTFTNDDHGSRGNKSLLKRAGG